MIKIHALTALLALSGVAILPACSMSGGGNDSRQVSRANYSAPQSPVLSQDTIQRVQTRLQQAGAYNGRIDGLWGPATEAGVRNYQQQHNLNATGQLDGDTLASLNLGGTPQNYGNAQPNGNVMPDGTTQPNVQRYGANNTAPVYTVAPAGNATQPNATTP